MSFPSPLVSICCLTYNHSPFIRKCLDGFLMQKTDFPIEILIHDDASTDGTDDIIREYTAKYPSLIFPLYETENQYSQGHASDMDIKYNYSRARGKYIAYCEGDDFWTDPLKLQKQVDFMETHLDYSVCFTRYKKLKESTGEVFEDKYCETLLKNIQNSEGVEILMQTYLNNWATQALTMMFRKDKYDFTWCRHYKYYRDFHEIYHLINAGQCRLLNFCSGVYRLTGNGIYTQLAQYKRDLTDVKVNEDLWKGCHDKRVKEKYAYSIQYLISTYYKEKDHKFGLLKYSCIYFLLKPNIKSALKNLYHIFK